MFPSAEVTEKTSGVLPSKAVEVCLMLKPVVLLPVGASVWVEVGLLTKQLVQDEPLITPQVGRPLETTSTLPSFATPPASLDKTVVSEA